MAAPNRTGASLVPRGSRTVAAVLATYTARGWARSPTAHHPEPIRRALREAHIRPAIKQCFSNCQRLAMSHSGFMLNVKLHEGWVMDHEFGIAFEHSWISVDGINHDLTVTSHWLEVFAGWHVTEHELAEHITKTRRHGPVNQLMFDVTHPYRELMRSLTNNATAPLKEADQ